MLFCYNNSFATHVMGGKFEFTQIGSNTFIIELWGYRDCINGNPSATFAPSSVGVWDGDTNASPQVQIATIDISNNVTINRLALGDPCYTPNLCVEEYYFIDTITLANNANGYYLTYGLCCRNRIVDNIFDPESQGSLYYIYIPDPAIAGGNSSPKWAPYPTDAYFCVGNVKVFDFGVTDIDGDDLRFSLVTPLNWTSLSYPFDNVPWEGTPVHNLASILGPGSMMSIDPVTGILTARSSTLGVYNFSIKVEEFRNGVKIGEMINDYQWESLNCVYDESPEFANFERTQVLEFDALGCFDIVALDPNPNDPIRIELTSNAAVFGSQNNLPTQNAGGDYTFNYIDATTGSSVNETFNVTQLDPNNFSGTGFVGARFCWTPNECEVLVPDEFNLNLVAIADGCDGLADTITEEVKIIINRPTDLATVPNVFSPNGDGDNDEYNLIGKYDRCYDVLNVKIYNRWGIQVYESDDPEFRWDGTDFDGDQLNQGTYYVMLEGFYANTEVTNQFPVTIFR